MFWRIGKYVLGEKGKEKGKMGKGETSGFKRAGTGCCQRYVADAATL
jgi:hypothetical protein